MARFPRRARLCKAREYSKAFTSPARLRNQFFDLVVHARPDQPARLGLAISRKALPRAVDRNRLKRIVRESFRAQSRSFACADIVVMARAASATVETAILRTDLEKLWQEVAQRCRPS